MLLRLCYSKVYDGNRRRTRYYLECPISFYFSVVILLNTFYIFMIRQFVLQETHVNMHSHTPRCI